MKKALIDFYLEYVNNFLTTAYMAEYFEMPKADCIYLIELGKQLHEQSLSNKNKTK